MNCEAIDELLAAYALSALAQDEAAQARAHLTSCRKHDAALADLQLVAGQLPLMAGEREPPAALRARLLRAFDAELAPRAPAARQPARASMSWWRRPVVAWATAATLLLAAIGLVSWNVALQVGGDESSHTMRATLQGGQGTGRLVYLEDEQIAILTLDMPGLPATRAYQAWSISSGGPVSLGLVGNGVTALSTDLSAASAVAITEEPAGGSSQPTSDPVLSAQLPDRS